MLVDVINIALKAGDRILRYYNGKIDFSLKNDNSPVTEADKRANDLICRELNRLDPHCHILSEENKDVKYEIRKDWDRLWLVDPLDGTKEFIRKRGEFTINIALVEKGEPVLGVVYAPALRTLYFSQKGKGAYKLENIGGKMAQKGLKGAFRLPLERSDNGVVKIVASRSHMNENTKEFIGRIKGKVGKVDIISIGSALKICLVAEGKADIYPRFGPTKEWDTAAGHAIAIESGCDVRIYNGKLSETLIYNKKDLLNPNFVVFRKESAFLLE